MKVKITKSDMIWSYIGFFFTICTNVLILPFVMKMVPKEELGLWYTFLSIGQVATIFEGTFSNSISRNVTYAWSGLKEIQAKGYKNDVEQKEPNYRLLISLVRTCQVLFGVIAVIAVILLGTLGTIYIRHAANSIDSNQYLIAWLIYLVSVFLNLYYCYWLTALRGVGALKQAQVANTVSKIIQIVISLIGLFLGGGIIGLSLAYFISNFAMRAMAKHSFYHYEAIKEKTERYKYNIRKGEIKNNFIKIWYNAKKNGLNCIGAFAVTQSTTLICTAFLGVDETASYGLCLQIVNALAGIALIYFNAVKPSLTEYEVVGHKELFNKLLSLSVVIFWIVYLVEFIAILTIGLPLIGLLKADTEIPMFMFVFMSLYLFLENNHSLFNGVIEMQNRVLSVPASLVSGGMIVLGDLLIVQYTNMGIYGLMFVQFIVQLCYNNWKWPSFVFKEYSINIGAICKTGTQELINILKKYVEKER